MNVKKLTPRQTDTTWNIPTLVGLAGLLFTIGTAIWTFSGRVSSMETTVHESVKAKEALTEELRRERDATKMERFGLDQRIRSVERSEAQTSAILNNLTRQIDALVDGVEGVNRRFDRLIVEQKAENDDR